MSAGSGAFACPAEYRRRRRDGGAAPASGRQASVWWRNARRIESAGSIG